jgi:hypothetical protein
LVCGIVFFARKNNNHQCAIKLSAKSAGKLLGVDAESTLRKRLPACHLSNFALANDEIKLPLSKHELFEA